MKIRTEDFFKAVGASLEEYAGSVTEATKKVVKEEAESCRKEIREKAPKRTGKYKKSWKLKTAYDGTGGIRMIVYSGDGQYRLTHLLEKGHAKRGGGRVRAYPHIGPAAERVQTELPQKLKKAIGEVNGSE